MQKLEERNTFIPRNAPQVSGSMTHFLNREETLSEMSLKTFSNSSDVDTHSGKSEQSLRVFVMNMRGEALMPTTSGKARRLLKAGKVKVVRTNPFTIQLKYSTGEAKQSITLGIDPGYHNIGFSAITSKRELLSGEVKLRTYVSKKLTERRMYRRNRRSRLWHRKPRWFNRVSSKKKGWLAPSIKHRLDSHIRLIEQIKKLLPVSEIAVEVANFDTQKMQNPEISGIEYQQGALQGYAIREYLLDKWGRKCAYCGKANVPLEIEHIIPKSRGGTSRVSNLTIACHRCNQKKGNKTAEEFGYPKTQKKAKETLKAAAFMNNIRWKLVNLLNCQWTYGYITKHNRIKLGLEKTHYNDAFVIAGGNKQERIKPQQLRQTRRNNRSLQTNRKGHKPSIRRQRYKLQPNDLVCYKKLLCRVKGVFNYGKWVRVVTKTNETINTNIKNVKILKYGKGIQWM